MEFILKIIDFFLHLDKYLAQIIEATGSLSYIILFLVIFCETGLVAFPFLPGDSLLFAAGALSAKGYLNIVVLYVSLIFAAIIGDTVNYWIGHYIGPKAFNSDSRFLKKKYLLKAQEFYDKHGGKAIVFARFVPVVRTFAPFVAGIGKMDYKKFISYNIFGGFLWVTLFLLGGFFLGNIPIIKENFHYTVVLIILISFVPIFYEYFKERQKTKTADEK